MFDYCISLGSYCAVALSMQRYGLRSSRGPFDWCVSNLESIIKVMDTDFIDFMDRKNLYIAPGDKLIFVDEKYGFRFKHDIDSDFEKEYDNIHNKYMRIVNKFLNNISSPTCFIRSVQSLKEVEYINYNNDMIRSVIKKRNPNNDIIFLKSSSINYKIVSDFKSYEMNSDIYLKGIYDMSNLFQHSQEFMKYCCSGILSLERREKNYISGKDYINLAIAAHDILLEIESNNVKSLKKLNDIIGDNKSEIYMGCRILWYIGC